MPGALAVELILDRTNDAAAGGDKAFSYRVHVRHGEMNPDRRAAQRFGADSAVIGRFIGEHDAGAANTNLSVADAIARHVQAGHFDGAESIFVKFDRACGAFEDQECGCGLSCFGCCHSLASHWFPPFQLGPELSFKIFTGQGAQLAGNGRDARELLAAIRRHSGRRGQQRRNDAIELFALARLRHVSHSFCRARWWLLLRAGVELHETAIA